MIQIIHPQGTRTCNPGIKHTGEADKGETTKDNSKVHREAQKKKKPGRKSLSGDKGFQKKSQPVDCNPEGNRSQN